MMARVGQVIGIAIGASLFLAALGWPALALFVRALENPPDTAYLSGFPARLFWYSLGLALSGAVLALLLALPGAFVVARIGSRAEKGARASDTVHGLRLALIAMPLLFPAMVYAFGWDRLLKGPGALRCVGVWASWAWPLPAFVLGSGWQKLGRRRFESALLSTTPFRAFMHAALPMLWRHALACFLVLVAFFLGDYAVPHACGLLVYATELLLAAEASPHPRAALLAALPVALTIVGLLIVAGLIFRRFPNPDETDDSDVPARVGGFGWVAPIIALVCVVVPLVGLMRSVPLVTSVEETVRMYGTEILESLGVALLGGVAAVGMGAALAVIPGVRWIALGWALIWAAIPGALVGQAIIFAYLQIPAVYDHWVILVLGYVARFGWVGIAAAFLARHSAGEAQLDAARSDGASVVTASWRVGLAGNLPTLACAVFVIAALSLSEVATTALVRVPAVNPVSLIMIEKFHRFEDGIMIGICLLLMLAAIPGAVFAGWVTRRIY